MQKWWFVLALACACTNNSPPACITVDTSCAPLYPPSFDNVYNNTLSVSCGSTNTSCHANAEVLSGMSFADEPTAYSELLMKSKFDPSHYRVDPGDPSCSVMIVRTDSPGAPYQMPIGTALGSSERCALIQWVQAGAPGPGSAAP